MKVLDDDQEVGAFLFRRTVPAIHLTPEDVRWMVCLFSSYPVVVLSVAVAFRECSGHVSVLSTGRGKNITLP